jgi:hypothetical protein
MPNLRLTRENIERIVLPEKGEAFYWDTKVKGFGLRVTAKGMRFIVQTRIATKSGPRITRIKIGTHGRLAPDQAEKQAKILLGQVESGTDPNREKQAKRIKARTLGEVFEEYVTRKKNLRPRTVKLYGDVFRLALSDWSNRPLHKITKDDAERRYADLCEKWRAVDVAFDRSTDGKALASQAMRLLSQLYNFENNFYEKDLINPVKRLKYVYQGWSQTRRRTAVVLDRELALFNDCLKQLQRPDTRDYREKASLNS